MNDFSWQADLHTGISVLDKQYNKAFKLTNQLDSAITFHDISQLESISQKIYIQFNKIYHYEQPLLQNNKNQVVQEQLQSYNQFLNKIDDLRAEIINGDQMTAASKLHFEVKSWLKGHLAMAQNHLQATQANHEVKQKKLSAWVNFFK